MHKERFMTRVAVYLVLKNTDGEILLAQRQNTGFADGLYSLVSGHVEANETVFQAMIREAHEEAGIIILAENLDFVHIVQHQSGPIAYMDFYLQCCSWNGLLVNCEPEKCAELSFFSLHALPENVAPHVRRALAQIESGKIFSDFGFVPNK